MGDSVLAGNDPDAKPACGTPRAERSAAVVVSFHQGSGHPVAGLSPEEVSGLRRLLAHLMTNLEESHAQPRAHATAH